MGTPPDKGDDGDSGGDGDGGLRGPDPFAPLSLTRGLPGSTLSTLSGQSGTLITSGFVLSGSLSDLSAATSAYQAALAYLESNRNLLSPADLAVLEVEVAITWAAILALKARLQAANGLPYTLAELESAYAEAAAALASSLGLLSADQQAAAYELLAAIASVITALQE